MAPSTYVLILLIVAVLTGITSAAFWLLSARTKYVDKEAFVYVSGSPVVNIEKLNIYLSSVSRKYMLAASFSGATALLAAGIIVMHLVRADRLSLAPKGLDSTPRRSDFIPQPRYP